MTLERSEYCLAHSGIEKELENIKEHQIEQNKCIDKAHERIDGMKNWVIAGMSSLVAQLILWIISLIVAYLKLKGSI